MEVKNVNAIEAGETNSILSLLLTPGNAVVLRNFAELCLNFERTADQFKTFIHLFIHIHEYISSLLILLFNSAIFITLNI